jgi:SpoIID/LytB domain protein
MTAALVIPATLTLPVAGSLASSPKPVRAELATIALESVEAGALESTPSPRDAVPIAGEDHAHHPDDDDHGDAGSGSVRSASTALEPAAAIPATETEPFGLVGITAAEPFDPATRIVMRVRQGDTWLPWMEVPLSEHMPDPDTEEGQRARYATEPVVTDGADGIQVRVDTPTGEVPADTELTMIDNPQRPEDARLGVQAGPASNAEASVRRPTIITRAQWGADESLRRGTTAYSQTVKVAFVHHVVSTNNYTEAQAAQQMRNVYSWFTQGIKVNDFGYNFMVDRFGRLYEGRAGGVNRAVIGSHTSGFNAETFAVSFLGNADTLNPDSPERERILNAISDLIAWKFEVHNVNPLGTAVLTSAGPGPGQGTTSKYWPGEKVMSQTIAGHGDIGATSCPGVFLRPSLDHIRLGVSARQGRNFYPPSIRGDRVPWGTGGNITLNPRSNGPMSATLTISNACGEQVRSMSASTSVAATLPFTWDLRDSRGRVVPPGLYTFQIAATGNNNGRQLFPWSGTARIAATADSPPDPCTPPAQFTIEGTGYGHGVGLSQWGAFAMATADPKRWTAKRIVEHYYKDVTVREHPDAADVRIALLQQVTRAQARVESLGNASPQMEVSFGSKAITLGTDAQLTFAPSGRFVTVDRTDGGRTQRLGRGKTVTLKWSGTRDPGAAGSTPGLLNVIGPSESFTSTGHRYRYGTIDLTSLVTPNGRRLNVVNTLRLGDEYLRGIAEVNPTWPDAALQAQAIASRSYALARLARGTDASCSCHMDDGDGPKFDQTFRGWLAESQYGAANRWAQAVEATRIGTGTGLTALHQGTPINAFYTAATGGRTISAAAAWGGAGHPWSVEVEDAWSRNAPGNPYRSWSVSLTQARAAQIFGISQIMRLVPDRIQESNGDLIGAVRSVTAHSLTGQRATLPIGRLRAAVGYTAVKSPYIGRITGQDVAGPTPAPQGGVTLVANPAGNVTDGTLVTLSGVIAQPRAGLTVQRQVQVNGGAWQNRNSATPDSQGRFTFAVPVTGVGTTYSWRVVVLDGSTPVASSRTLVAQVLANRASPPSSSTSVSLSARPAGDVRDGTVVTLSGAIAQPRAGLTVQRQVQVNGGAWQNRNSATPDGQGRFTFAVPATGKGTTYTWRVVVMDGRTVVATSRTLAAKVL